MPQSGPYHILVADDTRGNRVIIKTALKDFNVQLHQVEDGEEAVKLAEKHEFALLLLDVNMPNMGGLEAAAQYRLSELNQHTPIIFLTADAQSDDAIFQGYETGAVDYIFKPFNAKHLAHKVKVFLEIYEQKRCMKTLMAKLSTAVAEKHKHQVDKNKLKKELVEIHNKKLVGDFAEGIARGLNTIVQKMKADMEPALSLTDKAHPSYQHLSNLSQSLKKNSDFVLSLMMIAQQNKEHSDACVDVRYILNESLAKATTSLPDNITIDLNVDVEAGAVVFIDFSNIDEILQYIYSSSIKAMTPQGGVLKVTLENKQIDEFLAVQEPHLEVGAYYLITIVDSGEPIELLNERQFNDTMGLSDSIESRMGLSSIRRFAREFGGDLRLKEVQEKGNIYYLYLPKFQKTEATITNRFSSPQVEVK